jgi:hypothetical protein
MVTLEGRSAVDEARSGSMSDMALVRAGAAGDRAALDQLFRPHEGEKRAVQSPSWPGRVAAARGC